MPARAGPPGAAAMRRTPLGCLGLLALLPALPAWAQDAPAGLPRLSGVIIGPAHRTAIFEQPAGGPSAVEEGEQVAGYLVRMIRPDGVLVESEGRSYTIAPSPLGAGARLAPADTGGATFGLVVNPQTPAPD